MKFRGLSLALELCFARSTTTFKNKTSIITIRAGDHWVDGKVLQSGASAGAMLKRDVIE